MTENLITRTPPAYGGPPLIKRLFEATDETSFRKTDKVILR